jgi:hypothetical protein
MICERGAAFLAEPGHHIEHARRQELLAHFGEQQHAQRGILRRLQDECVAGNSTG